MEGISWKPTDAIEILIGVYLYFGAMDQSMFPTELIWDKKSGDKMACSTFTSNRFLNLSNNRLRFDDKSTQSNRRQRDAFSPIRDV